jgi:hypothetical protein
MYRSPAAVIGVQNEVSPTSHTLSKKKPFAAYINFANYPLMTVRELSPKMVNLLALAF